MRVPVLYMNELSCACEGLSRETIALYLESMIVAVNQVVDQRKDTIVRLHCGLGELTLGEQYLSLGAVLPGPNGRVAQLKRLIDRAPCGPVAALSQEVRSNGKTSIGLTWAVKDDGFVFSLGPSWSAPIIRCDCDTIDELCAINRVPVDVRNFATSAHVNYWRQTLDDHGKEVARSSRLWEGSGFVIRMHFHDHPPPHVHIYPRPGDTNNRIARVRVDNGDILDGTLSSAMNDEITELLKANKETLLQGWANIQAGKLPIGIQ